jgi:hypothetical protein
MHLSYTDLIQRTIQRVRQVPGAGAQLYSEDELGNLIKEVYYRVRSKQYWEHLMKWVECQLDGVAGRVVTPFTTVGYAVQGGDDVQAVYMNTSQRPLPQLGSLNPRNMLGTVPKYMKKLSISDDPFRERLFEIYPKTAVTTATTPLMVYARFDPTNLFTNPSIIVPFDSSVLINGAAAEYLSFDGAQARGPLAAYNERLQELEKAQNSAPIILDSRTYNPFGPDRWIEADF